jgi:hypothetical protein
MVAGRLIVATVPILVVPPLAAQAQRWSIEPRTSLAWWQIDPHYEHLWATTCPADPSWQPGEGRDPGLYTDYSTRPTTIAAARSDQRIPLFPRYRVRALCRQAVRGEIAVDDEARLSGVRGRVTLIADSLFTGLEMRDIYARRSILETMRYPEIAFVIDSVVDAQGGDTIRATAVGSFELHGVSRPMRAPLIATRDPAGLRIRAQFSVPASQLTDEFLMSKWGLGMGVVLKRWKTIHMGVDIILRPTAS